MFKFVKIKLIIDQHTAICASLPSQFCLSIRESVCPSLCQSHGWISQKRCKLGSPNLHSRLPGRL